MRAAHHLVWPPPGIGCGRPKSRDGRWFAYFAVCSFISDLNVKSETQPETGKILASDVGLLHLDVRQWPDRWNGMLPLTLMKDLAVCWRIHLASSIRRIGRDWATSPQQHPGLVWQTGTTAKRTGQTSYLPTRATPSVADEIFVTLNQWERARRVSGERFDWFVLIRRHARRTFIARVDELLSATTYGYVGGGGVLSFNSNEGPFGGQQRREQNSSGRRSK